MKNKKGFTLVEMMVSLAICATAVVMVMTGILQMSEGVRHTQSLTKTGADIATFCDMATNYINNSFAAYFLDSDDNLIQCNSTFVVNAANLNQFNAVYLRKEQDPLTTEIATFQYNEGSRRFEWFSGPGQTAQPVLSDVYRMDVTWNANGTVNQSGIEPIFKYPHIQSLFDDANQTLLRFVIIQFRKRVGQPNDLNPVPVTIPITLMVEVYNSRN